MGSTLLGLTLKRPKPVVIRRNHLSNTTCQTQVFFKSGEESSVGGEVRLRTNGVDTNGAAAKVINFDRFGKKVRPWHFWEEKSRLTGVPQKSLCQTKT